ncbi:MAG TPA: sigma-70 family RNA polymerase sigma factor [Bryobacteraceae bacterium]|nr:sigma-70 family RNA polymerase sigma factor [Bryobacteraceae bacterium]
MRGIGIGSSKEADQTPAEVQRFEEAMIPHLDAAYNLARWLAGNQHDAEDVVQESYLRALKFFGGFRGGNARGWLLAIVRNTCYDWLRRNRPNVIMTELDENMPLPDPGQADPETLFLAASRRETVRRAIEALPVEFRDVVILRELEGMSYKQISEVAEIPVGTVMSRLARARARLEKTLMEAQAMGERA